jgi:hypothetical protein
MSSEELLISRANSDDWWERYCAAASSFCPLDVLEKLTRDKNRDVRVQAKQTLVKVREYERSSVG